MVRLLFPGVGGTFTVTPSNTAAVSGDSVTLQCSSSLGSSAVFWQLQPAITYIVEHCILLVNYTSLYAVDSSTSGQCDLIVLGASEPLAGTYTCIDGLGPSGLVSAFLTVLG